jgi:O-6-methylguanine DNA methyltransferase
VRSVKTPPPASFRQRVLAAVRRIPPGRVATYGDVASVAGSPRAWRAVGNIMRECRDPGTPCHRVIGAGGALGGYGGNLQLKRELLRAEGIEVGPPPRSGASARQARIRRFRDVRWTARVDRRIRRDP